jgi:hypothetical protein
MANSSFKIRSILLGVGLLLGLIIGFVLNLAWYFLTLVVLGYGNSAPESYIRVQGLIELVLIIGSIIICLLASQWYYHYIRRKGKL